MAITKGFSYTNKEAGDTSRQVTTVKIQPMLNYALIEDEPTRCVLQNTTGSIDQPERLIFQRSDVKNVPVSFTTANPDPNLANIQYGVKLEAVLRVKSTTDDSFIKDLPITTTITFKHPVSEYMSADDVALQVSRILTALQTNSSDLAPRINELMRGSLKPTKQ